MNHFMEEKFIFITITQRKCFKALLKFKLFNLIQIYNL